MTSGGHQSQSEGQSISNISSEISKNRRMLDHLGFDLKELSDIVVR